MSSATAYAIVLVGFLAAATLVIAPLRRKLVGSILWLSAKLLATAASLGLGIYCSFFHGTSFFFFRTGTEMKGHLSFAAVLRLRRDPQWMASNELCFAERYHERIIYMIALALVAAAAAALAIQRYRAAQKARTG